MELRDPDAIAKMRAGFDAQGVMKTLGAAVEAVAPGRVTLTMPFSADFTQHHGFIHAGVLTTVLDSACGFAAFTLMDPGSEVLTVEFKSSFLKPARGQSFRFVGEVLKSGRTLLFTQGTAYALDNDVQTAVSTMSATMMAVRDPKIAR